MDQRRVIAHAHCKHLAFPSRRAHAFVDDMKRRAVEPPTRGGIAGRMQALYQWARIWRNRALRPDVLRAIA
jgi:hypothetical protein